MSAVPPMLGAAPSVNVPRMPRVAPGASMPLELTVTWPLMIPLPPSVPPFTVTVPLPVPLPELLFTSSAPASTVVPPL